ncbi:NAD(P)/FAD-dependent oxidoreductase [Marinobacter confluentis]|uniref:NAD(P)/FAD-dependent oxidoreductase n=1 Tax=Marinobacter confluentis TaxID=1697557 RepID=A0A4Z1BBK9_9GAMM|nr:FAD-dependent oxidoreductase [Marinobacter confluentis]TGN39356.1 NAD(P)/FAD-dependent oxidoreductase [Marinobacter confluentis]
MGAGSEQTLVICGHGMVAQRLLEQLVQQPGHPYQRIVVFNGEATPAYNRIQLSSVLAGEADERSLALSSADWFARHGITVHRGDPVVSLNRDKQTITTASGHVEAYDRLVMATGSSSAKLGIDGENLKNVMTFRDLDDTRRLIELSQRHRRALVIGGGFLGLEAAEGLRSRGMAVTVLHRSAHLLNRQLDDTGGALLEDALTDRGMSIRTGTSPTALLGRNLVRAVQLDDETLISTDVVVVAAGISPNIELAREAGLTCERAIVVDEQLTTSDPKIHALGECCQVNGETFGLVEPGYQQAEVLAKRLANPASDTAFHSALIPSRLKISGISIFSCGEIRPDRFTESVVWQDLETSRYCRLLIRDQRLKGVVLVGDTSDGLWFSERIQQADDISAYRDHLAFGKHYCEAA